MQGKLVVTIGHYRTSTARMCVQRNVVQSFMIGECYVLFCVVGHGDVRSTQKRCALCTGLEYLFDRRFLGTSCSTYGVCDSKAGAEYKYHVRSN